MSFYTFSGPIQKPRTTVLSGTGETVIAAPAGKAIHTLVCVSIANTTASPCEITLKWNDGTNRHVFWHKDVPADDTVECSFPMVFGTAESNSVARSIMAQAETGAALTVTALWTIGIAANNPRPGQ